MGTRSLFSTFFRLCETRAPAWRVPRSATWPCRRPWRRVPPVLIHWWIFHPKPSSYWGLAHFRNHLSTSFNLSFNIFSVLHGVWKCCCLGTCRPKGRRWRWWLENLGGATCQWFSWRDTPGWTMNIRLGTPTSKLEPPVFIEFPLSTFKYTLRIGDDSNMSTVDSILYHNLNNLLASCYLS